jgi:hypothetical protein
MSLLVHVFVLDADGKMQLLEEPRGVSDLAGFENWRTQVWGSEVVRSLGARFFPALADGDLEVAAGQVPAFKDECLLLRENLETIVTQTAAGRTAEEHRTRFRNGWHTSKMRFAERKRQTAASSSGDVPHRGQIRMPASAMTAQVAENAVVTDHLRCRLSFSEDDLELAGPPAALRALAVLLRHHAEPVEVSVTGGTVAQHVTSGPLLVDRQGATTMRLSGGREYLDIVWDALDGVADEAETTDDRGVNRHQHIEYLPDDEYRSTNSVPLVIVADWPDELLPRTR